METKINPRIYFAVILVLLCIIIAQFIHRSRFEKRRKKLIKSMEDLVHDLQKNISNNKAESPEDDAAEILERLPISEPDHQDNEETYSKDAEIIPIIPASLRYKIQPLEGKFTFNAISTKKGGGYIYCNLVYDTLIFRAMNESGELRLTETRIWPVPEKEIGTILNTLLQPEKP